MRPQVNILDCRFVWLGTQNVGWLSSSANAEVMALAGCVLFTSTIKEGRNAGSMLGVRIGSKEPIVITCLSFRSSQL
jgi:hypothetical protein